MMHLPLKVKEKIWSFQYLDFTELLPDASKPAPSPIVFFRNADDDIIFDAKTKEKRIHSPQVLLQAFSTYAAILSVKFPNHSPELYQYMVDILNLANLHNWELVAAYDASFRMEIQENPAKSWAALDNVIFSHEIISPSMSIVQSKAAFSPAKPKSREVCRKYNAGRCN